MSCLCFGLRYNLFSHDTELLSCVVSKDQGHFPFSQNFPLQPVQMQMENGLTGKFTKQNVKSRRYPTLSVPTSWNIKLPFLLRKTAFSFYWLRALSRGSLLYQWDCKFSLKTRLFSWMVERLLWNFSNCIGSFRPNLTGIHQSDLPWQHAFFVTAEYLTGTHQNGNRKISIKMMGRKQER